jgi:hypothetical protein
MNRTPCFCAVALALTSLFALVACNRQKGQLDPGKPIAVLAYTVVQLPDRPCLAVEKSAFTLGQMPNIVAGTVSTAPRLLTLTPNNGAVEVKSWMFSEIVRKQGPGSKIWLELAKGQVNDLDADSRAVVDAVMHEFPGIELHDAAPRSNWIPMGANVYRGIEPAVGHAATDCSGTPTVPDSDTNGSGSLERTSDATPNRLSAALLQRLDGVMKTDRRIADNPYQVYKQTVVKEAVQQILGKDFREFDRNPGPLSLALQNNSMVFDMCKQSACDQQGGVVSVDLATGQGAGVFFNEAGVNVHLGGYRDASTLPTVIKDYLKRFDGGGFHYIP